ncbi:MAG: hypothetical protein HQ581_25725 [Planctomycetes bacterium]|nr:hypothetical protein [Planctomycetota bacterium]
MTDRLVLLVAVALFVILSGVACDRTDSVSNPADSLSDESGSATPEPEKKIPRVISIQRCRSYRISDSEAAMPKDDQAKVLLVVRIDNRTIETPNNPHVTADGKKYDKVLESVSLRGTRNHHDFVFSVPEATTEFKLHLTGEDPITIEAEDDIQELLEYEWLIEANEEVLSLVEGWDNDIWIVTSQDDPLQTLEGLTREDLAAWVPGYFMREIESFHKAIGIKEKGVRMVGVGPDTKLKDLNVRLFIASSGYAAKMKDAVKVQFVEKTE